MFTDEVIKAAKEGCQEVSSSTSLLLKGSRFQRKAEFVLMIVIFYQLKLGLL